MLIAHAPAGYLLTRFLSRTLFKHRVHPKRTDRLYQLMMAGGIIGGIMPDFDFIYHIFIDSDRTPHHSYITHMPLFWLGVLGVLFLVGKRMRNRNFIAVSTTLCCSALLHLVFDTLTGVVYWLYPFSKKGFNVFAVADVHVWWVHNYTNHWTFLIEIVIILTAMIMFLRVKETTAYVIDHFRQHEKLRAVTLRVGICAAGLIIIVLVGAWQFNIDNRIFRKVIELKNHVVRMAFSS
jgi:hypothetical protein